MERFYNEESDEEKNSFFNSDDDDDDDDDDELVGYMDQEGILNVMQIDIAEAELQHDLLGKAMQIAENSWSWKFKSHTKKLDIISMIYTELAKLLGKEEVSKKEENEEEEEDADDDI